jgi:hypothetical protein
VRVQEERMEQSIKALEAMSSGGFSISEVHAVIFIIFALYVGFFIAKPLLRVKIARLVNRLFPIRLFRKTSPF